MGRSALDRVLHFASDQTNTQLNMLALGVLTSRYFINTSTEQAEKAGLMVYISAKKGKDELWQLVSGNLLAGITPSLERGLTVDVFGRQDKQVKKGKQEALNNEHRRNVEARLNPGSQ